jgi:hypothetical protein
MASPATAVARSDKIRDAEIVPLACQIVKPAEHPSGHHRSAPTHRPAPELAQHRPPIVYRPLELLVEGHQIRQLCTLLLGLAFALAVAIGFGRGGHDLDLAGVEARVRLAWRDIAAGSNRDTQNAGAIA